MEPGRNDEPGMAGEALMDAQIPCGLGMGRLKSSNSGMKPVNDFEARVFGELSRALEIVFLYCALW